MRILRLRAYFSPEKTSGLHLDNDLNEALAKSNITCVNYTPIPTRGVSRETTAKYRTLKTEVLYNGKFVVNRFAMFREG